MKQFFSPHPMEYETIPMYGSIHMINIVILILLAVLVITNKKTVKRLGANRRFMKLMIWGFLAQEFLWNTILWVYKYEPFHGRFPFHLCAILSILIPIALLKRNDKMFQFLGYWAICTGAIAFINPSYQNIDPISFHFLQYNVRHYFLFIIPIFMHIANDFEHDYKFFLRSMGSLTILTTVVFFVNWITGADYFYLGRESNLAIPFLPQKLSTWPWIFPSFVVVGITLLHVGFASLRSIKAIKE